MYTGIQSLHHEQQTYQTSTPYKQSKLYDIIEMGFQKEEDWRWQHEGKVG